MNGLLFPGQGSQAVGMGKLLYERLPSARKLLERASTVLGYDIGSLMFNGPEASLTDTKYAQPAIYTCSSMYLEKLKSDGMNYSYVAGHSLGEYNALMAANLFDFETGLKLVAARGEAMSRMNGKGTMAAVLGLEESELEKYLDPDTVIANLNAKTQIVISGPDDGIERVRERLIGRENIRFQKLRVSAAFHSPQMAEAAELMNHLIRNTAFNDPRCFVVSNVTGKASKSAEEIKANLIAQITGQVRWSDSVLTMKEAGVSTLYEVGFSDVLKKISKTITFRPKCVAIEV